MEIPKKLRSKIKIWLNLWDIEDLTIGAHCGLCGLWLPNIIIDKLWRVDLCKKCCGKNKSETRLYRNVLKEAKKLDNKLHWVHLDSILNKQTKKIVGKNGDYNNG